MDLLQAKLRKAVAERTGRSEEELSVIIAGFQVMENMASHAEQNAAMESAGLKMGKLFVPPQRTEPPPA